MKRFRAWLDGPMDRAEEEMLFLLVMLAFLAYAPAALILGLTKPG